MSLFTVEEVLQVTGARVLSGATDRGGRTRIRRVCTDSREVGRGDLFVALKGERFDGHQFVKTALAHGAVCAVVQDRPGGPGVANQGGRSGPLLLGVPAPLQAFQQLAAHHRSRFAIPVVAVTGSNGKTTTKDMVAGVLAARWPGAVLKTQGNLNNRIGVPRTLLRLSARHKAAVIEMGVDQKGQTARLCEIARPTIGLITNVGPDHLEFFGSMAASAEAKGELLDLLPHDGAVALNTDDAYFGYFTSRARCPVVGFGSSEAAQVRADQPAQDPKRGMRFGLRLPGRAQRPRVRLAAHGQHNLSNALAAAAVGYLLGVGGAGIARGLGGFRPAAMRSQVEVWRGITIINDCYNANPASMKAAIDLLVELGTGCRTIAVLGDMLELGSEAKALHREVGAHLAGRQISWLIACGSLGRELAEGARAAGMPAEAVREAPDATVAGSWLKAMVRTRDVVLVKASRGMQMERAIEALRRGRR